MKKMETINCENLEKHRKRGSDLRPATSKLHNVYTIIELIALIVCGIRSFEQSSKRQCTFDIISFILNVQDSDGLDD